MRSQKFLFTGAPVIVAGEQKKLQAWSLLSSWLAFTKKLFNGFGSSRIYNGANRWKLDKELQWFTDENVACDGLMTASVQSQVYARLYLKSHTDLFWWKNPLSGFTTEPVNKTMRALFLTFLFFYQIIYKLNFKRSNKSPKLFSKRSSLLPYLQLTFFSSDKL